jgi:hypothetical protein
MTDKKMTMDERIQAFYKQSGGPNNPDIERILENHLLYGKNHGMKGKKETVEDALRDALTEDKSTSLLIDWLATKKIERMSKKYEEEEHWMRVAKEISQGFREGIESIHSERIAELEAEIRELRHTVMRLSAQLEYQMGFTNESKESRFFRNDIV